MTETTWVSFRTLSMCLPLKTLSHFPFKIGLLSFFDSWCLLLSPQLRSGLWSFEFSSLKTFSIVNNLSVHCFEQFLGRTKPRQSEAEQSPVILTCTILRGSHLTAYRLLIIEFDPIERRSLGYGINLRVIVLLHKLQLHGNACPSWESVVILSTLLFDTYYFSEGYLRVENPLQCGRNHRIKHVIIREISSSYNRTWCLKFVSWLCHLNFLDPVHCEMSFCWFWTYFSFEVDFPAWKFHWIRIIPTCNSEIGNPV